MEVKSAIAKKLQRYISPDDKSKLALEIGAGDGVQGEHFGRLNPFSVIASVDLRGSFVPRQKNHQFVLANCQNLPFKDETFDVAVAVRSLHFIEDLKKGLREIDRVLKPGGILLVISYPIFRFENSSASEIFNKFCQNLLHTELKEYWSSTTAENFFNYCDPGNEDRKKFYGDDEEISFNHEEEIDLLDLETIMLESEIVKRFILRHGKLLFDQEFEELQRNLLELNGYVYSDLLFVNCRFMINFQITLLVSKKSKNVIDQVAFWEEDNVQCHL